MENNDYLKRMQHYENVFAENMNLAKEAYDTNGKHTKEECTYYQKAAMCQMEMANISLGAEKTYHQQRLREINQKIEQIVKELNPDAYQRMMEKKNGQTKKQESGREPVNRGGGSGAAQPVNTDNVDTSGWFKEAPAHSFADVAGMEDLKAKLRECVNDSKYSLLKQYLKLPNLHSYFFIGPPGCGKTFIIEAFAHELIQSDYKYISLAGSDILSKYVGEAEKIVFKLFEEAEKNAPCIVFIDEIDGVCKNRSLPNLPEYASSITTSFLTGYNRINSSDKKIIFIGATNYPDRVDNAMLDRVELIRVGFPDFESRKFAFEQRLKGIVQLAPDLTLDDMAEVTEDYNQRDITRLVNRIKDVVARKIVTEYPNELQAIQALKKGDFAIDRAIFEQARQDCLPTPKEDIKKALDVWEKKFKTGFEEDK